MPIEQSSHWIKTEPDTPARRHYGLFAYYDGSTLVATARVMIFTRRLRQSLVIVNGPVFFTARTAEAEAALVAALARQAREDPHVSPMYLRLQLEHPSIGASKALEAGWYEREIVVDLRPDEKDLLAGFRPNARQSIRKAIRAGVEVHWVPPEERAAVFRAECFPILRETAQRDEFSPFDSAYYERLLTELPGHTRLAVARFENRAVSWLITTEYRGHAVYYFAGSSADARRCFAPYLLLWEAFRVLKAAGNSACGLTGIVSESYPQLAGVTTFKRNWSKNEVDLPVTYDVPLQRLRYRALALALRLRRAVGGARRAVRVAPVARILRRT